MRIVLWTRYFWPHIGGAELLALQLARGLMTRGHAVQVVTAKSDRDLPDREQHQGVSIHRFDLLGCGQRRDAAAIRDVHSKIVAFKRFFAPDIVQLAVVDQTLLFHLHTDRAHAARLVVDVSHPLATADMIPGSVIGNAIRAASWAVSPSERTIATVRAVAPELGDRSTVVPPALPDPARSPRPHHATPRLMCIGRVVPEKGYDVAIRALAHVRVRHPDTRLAIVGDGPARAGLERLAGELGVLEAVEFARWVAPDRIPELLSGATMLVAPSRSTEPLGLVALQAAQMARPVVASAVAGLSELVADGTTGLLVAPGDDRALAAAIVSLLNDSERLAALGEAGRTRVEEEFSFDRYVERMEQVYMSALAADVAARAG
ncbi:MAG: glycosyltransferase family 4 protein [Phycisphaerae bacterium]|nr:glycosyltransferase family 4 protein [Phycisphaerae bacterium]